jgi:uncharacterized OsmC-like protein
VIKVSLPKLELTEKEKTVLESAGNHCPVQKSIHPDIVTEIEYNWL